MVELTLTEREQAAFRAVASADPVPGTPFPSVRVLQALAEVVRCDEVVVGRANDGGVVEQYLSLHAPVTASCQVQVCDGPLMVGLVHVGSSPAERDVLRRDGLTDELWLGFRNGPTHVVQLTLGRRRRSFDPRDIAALRLLAPCLQRQLRERPTPGLPASLTVQERRVLMRVAAGHSNAHIAESLEVAPSTVRKHLEHAYRKLGVNSRVAAVARMQGRDFPDLDLRERLERFA